MIDLACLVLQLGGYHASKLEKPPLCLGFFAGGASARATPLIVAVVLACAVGVLTYFPTPVAVLDMGAAR